MGEFIVTVSVDADGYVSAYKIYKNDKALLSGKPLLAYDHDAMTGECTVTSLSGESKSIPFEEFISHLKRVSSHAEAVFFNETIINNETADVKPSQVLDDLYPDIPSTFDLNDFIKACIENSEQPPFHINMMRPEGMAEFMIERDKEGLEKKYDFKALLNDPKKIKAMIGTDRLLFMDNQDFEEIKQLSLEYGRSHYARLNATKQWLEENYPEILKDVNEGVFEKDGVCLDETIDDAYSRYSLIGNPAGGGNLKSLSEDLLSTGILLIPFPEYYKNLHNFDTHGIYSNKVLLEEIEDQVAFLTLIHEGEHAAGREDLFNYIGDLGDEYDLYADTDYLIEMKSHVSEIEADAAIVEKFKYLIDPHAIDQFLAMRFLVSFKSQMTEEIYFPDGHDTAYFVRELDRNGSMPNYFETYESLNGFYEKTRQYFEFYNNGQADKEEIPTNVFLDCVREAMVQDPPVYNEAEILVAQDLMECADIVGAYPLPLSDYLGGLIKPPASPSPQQIPGMRN